MPSTREQPPGAAVPSAPEFLGRRWHARACVVAIAALAQSGAFPQTNANVRSGAALVADAEQIYAELLDAHGAIGLIDSGFAARYAGRDRDAWNAIRSAREADFRQRLTKLPNDGLSAADARAAMLMRRLVESTEASAGLTPAADCGDAARADLDYTALSEALYACFDEIGNRLEFERGTVGRVSAFDLLTRIDEPERRRRLFEAFVPLWRAIDADGRPGSPYRRLIAMAADRARNGSSEIELAAQTLGTTPAEVENWLEQVLDAWREIDGDGPVEPWDYRYRGGQAERELGELITRNALQPLSARYYRDLGIDLGGAGVLYDLDPRPGKAPLAYADFVTRGRLVDGVWQPTVARVSANYAGGGLSLLNELVHEDGHAAHMLALRTRPAFMDLGDSLFVEAWADVTSWNTFEPAWQRKYLGRQASEPASLRALYSGVMLDVAWALFELRMLREPGSDPNLVWTGITHRYLHVVQHPELAWWAVRVQLVESPGYMVNYGLGAVLTADLRQRIEDTFGSFETGNPRWYGWVSDRLLAAGLEVETPTLLREFLGRPVSPQALLLELQRLRAPNRPSPREP